MRWIKKTPVWKFASRLKLALLQMRKSAAYMTHRPGFASLKFFFAVEEGWKKSHSLHPFHAGGIKFHLRPMEWHLLEAVLMDREYGVAEKLFENAPPSIIVDAGANIGMFSVYAFSQWPHIRLLAVEPGPDTFALLEKNRAQNPSLAWENYQYALWESDGSISFETEGMSMAAHVSAASQGVQVPAIRLDHFMEKHLKPDERVSLLKMDIEGAEECVLRASAGSLKRVDAVIIEIHAGMCDEKAVREILSAEFPYMYDLSTPSTQYPVMVACRKEIKV